MKNLKLLLLTAFLFFGLSSHAQKIGDGVVVAHFNADWNKANAVTWLGDLEDCNVVKIDIVENPKLQKKHKIVVVPTIILFKDGEEIERWQANVSFAIEEESVDIQKEVDAANLSDF